MHEDRSADKRWERREEEEGELLDAMKERDLAREEREIKAEQREACMGMFRNRGRYAR